MEYIAIERWVMEYISIERWAMEYIYQYIERQVMECILSCLDRGYQFIVGLYCAEGEC